MTLVALVAAGATFVDPPPIPALLIHGVSERHRPLDFWTIHPTLLGEVLESVRRLGLRPISSAAIEAHLAGRLPLADALDAVVLTVDDGSASDLTHVAPELARRGQKALFFVVSGWGPPDRLGADQVRELARRGHEIGSHSVTHSPLAVGRGPRVVMPDGRFRRPIRGETGIVPTRASEEARIRGELAESRRTVSGWCGQPVTALAYPLGELDETTRALARSTGYRLAFTTDAGYIVPGTDAMALPRFQLNRDTPVASVEEYLDAPRRERRRTLACLAILAVLGAGAAGYASRRRAGETRSG
jgi:peptidoglycan/xylan/chitin deacetylase (PgdA/CDA1 family)